MKLMNPDGTTLQDGRHDLVLYKVVLKKEPQKVTKDIVTPPEIGSESSFQTCVYKYQKRLSGCTCLPLQV